MDVEYYGPNPVVQGCYLAALGAAARMAAAVGDDEFAVTCRKLLAAGTDATEARLDNGAYYQQQVIPPGDFGQMAPRLRHPALGAERPDRPEFQIGDGCGIDQLVGEVCARVAGLGPLFDPGHARTALRSIGRLNYVADFGDWANYVRSYAVHGERGHIVLSYPGGARGLVLVQRHRTGNGAAVAASLGYPRGATGSAVRIASPGPGHDRRRGVPAAVARCPHRGDGGQLVMKMSPAFRPYPDCRTWIRGFVRLIYASRLICRTPVPQIHRRA